MSTRTSEQVSSASQPDDDAVNRAKQEIQSLVQDVVALSKSEIEEVDFFAALLEKSISALAAIGGVVWTLEEGQPFKLQYQVNLQQTGLAASQTAQMQHAKLLGNVAKRGEPIIIPPHSGAGEGAEDEGAANPTEYLLIVAPIRTDRGVDGLVEIFQRVGARPTTQRGYLRFLVQMCEIAGEYLKTRRLRHFVTKQSLWEQLENFTASVHTKLDSRQTAFTIANEGRRLIGCDRVTVVLRKGSSYAVEAISGQDTFDKRSNVVRMLRELATVVIRSGEDLWYTGDTQNLAPQVEKAVNEYVDESHTKQIAVLPLREHDPHADDKTRDRKRENMLGAIVIEQLVDSRAPDGLTQRVDVVRRHSATALTNAQSHEGLFLLPVWRFIGKSRVLVTARNLPKTILALIAFTAAIVAMWLVSWDFNVVADGKLLPQTRANIFAAVDGRIYEVKVKEGQTVAQDEVVALQRSSLLEDQRAKLIGEIASNSQALRAADIKLGSLDRARTPHGDRLDAISEVTLLNTKARSLQDQLRLLEEQESRLNLTSPIDGMVVTRDVQKLLRDRPVTTGTKVIEIADPSKDWELEIKVPEAKMGHVIPQLHELLAKDPNAQLEVSFILATNPDSEDQLIGRIVKISPSAENEGESGNAVPMTVAFDQKELAKLGDSNQTSEAAIDQIKQNLKVGADVKVKINCGRKPIGYVWFHEIWEFIQSRILFRL